METARGGENGRECTEGEASTLKAVIPAAGLGTRFLPLTREQPKEMLPHDRPVIHWVVEEAIAAGIADLPITRAGGKRARSGSTSHWPWEIT